MNNGLAPHEQPKKKRGRPPGLQKTPSLAKQSSVALQPVAEVQDDGSPSLLSNCVSTTEQRIDSKQTPFSIFLSSALRGDRAEVTRVARELEVAENTVYRWINGSSDRPRPIHLRRLPDVLPEHRSQLISVINQTFGGVLASAPVGQREVYKDVYRRVLELNATANEDDTRFWQISQTVFEAALQHLDADHLGLAISYAKLMAPHEDGIHSLREVAMRGHAPWPSSFDSNVYFGSTTLVGIVAAMQRPLNWSSTDINNRTPVEVDDFERSAYAAPIMRGMQIAGVMIFSSTQSDFFDDPMVCQAVIEYTYLLNVGLSNHDFYPLSCLHLRPMPTLYWQREQIVRSYTERIVTYARKYAASRHEAELCIQLEMEKEFEKVAQSQDEQQNVVFERILYDAQKP
jgi:hypothetical protein